MKKITKTIMHKIRSIRESHYTASSMEKLQTVGAFLVLEFMIHALEFVYNDILHFTQADYEGFTEWVLLVTALMGIFVLVISDFIYALRLRFDRHRYKKHQNDESGTHNG